MTRKEEISAANPYAGSSEIAYGKKIGFIIGAEWADAHPMNPWISVKEGLPEPEQEVLLYDVDSVKHYAIGWLRKKKGYCKSKWFVANGYVTDDSITHWMPIVEPK